MMSEIKNKILEEIKDNQDNLVDICSKLVQVPSENPPSDTREIANTVVDILRQVEGAEVTLHTKEDLVVNVVARIKGNRPGKRLVFNGHLDTFPVGNREDWTVDPFSAVIKDGYLYGRGVSDMKGGIACSILAFMIMARHRDSWAGELVITLAGDEESMGIRGTKYLLETIPHAAGDAMISGDVGSPRILRFGEKGLLWLELHAVGRSAHGAHVHKGENAIGILIEGMTQIKQGLKSIQVHAPKKVTEAIKKASSKSEQYSGRGETEILQTLTVNFGVIKAGVAPDIVPAKALAECDIRIPVGITITEAEREIKNIVDSIKGLSYKMVRHYEANWSDVSHEIFSLTRINTQQIMDIEPKLTMRVGASDSRLYRNYGVPSVTCGLTSYNLGGPDEYIEINELENISAVHALTAFDFLSDQQY